MCIVAMSVNMLLQFIRILFNVEYVSVLLNVNGIQQSSMPKVPQHTTKLTMLGGALLKTCNMH